MHPELIRHREALERLCRQFRVRRLELFGSAATGSFHPGESDVDFLVEFEPLSSGMLVDAYFGLLEGLEDLFGRPIDLVMASAIKNPYFQQSVNATKVLVFAA